MPDHLMHVVFSIPPTPQEFYNGATQLGCPSKGGVGCQDRGTLSAWQDAQLHPVADPAAPTGGRDLFYLFNTYADKLRFVVDIDFRTSFDYLHLGVRLVGRTGLPPSPTNTRVLFAIMTSQRELFNGAYDEATGLVLVYAEARENGWFILDTHDVQPTEPSFPTSFDAVDGGVSNRYLEDELNVGIAFSVETADGQINWDLDPSRKSPFFGIHAGSYASGFTSFAPYAIVNLTSSDLCTSFFPWMSTFGPPAGGNGTDVNSTEGNSTEGNTTTTPPPPPMATLVGTPDPLLDGVYQSVVSVVAVGINHTSVDLVNPIHTHQTWIMHPITCFLGVNRTQVSLHSLELIPMGQEEVEALGGGGNLTSLGYNESEVGIITSTQGGMVALVTVLVDVGEGFVGDHPTEAARMNERLREGMTPPRSGEFSRAATVGLGERGTGADLLGGVGGAALAVVDSGVWRRFYQPPPPPTFSGGGSITWGASGEVWVWGVCLGLAMWFINPLRIE